MDTGVLIPIVGLLGIIVLAGFLRYRFKGEASFTIRDLVTFSFRGENLPDENNVETQDETLPSLALKILTESGVYMDDITIIQPQPAGAVQDHNFMFGLALQNASETSVPAQGIDIHVEISWRGEDLQRAPKFSTDLHHRTTPGWRVVRAKVQQKSGRPRPAVLEFKGSEQDRCAFGHPLEWHRFRGRLPRKLDGHFLLHYRVTSANPHTSSTGELKIILQ